MEDKTTFPLSESVVLAVPPLLFPAGCMHLSLPGDVLKLLFRKAKDLGKMVLSYI